jgi:hypothetical protein
MRLNLEMMCLLLMMCFLSANETLQQKLQSILGNAVIIAFLPDTGQNIFSGTRDIRVTNSVLSRKD